MMIVDDDDCLLSTGVGGAMITELDVIIDGWPAAAPPPPTAPPPPIMAGVVDDIDVDGW